MIMTANAHELLIPVILTDRCNQDAARREPFDKSLRDLCCRGGHEHTVVRHLLGPALCPIAKAANNVVQAELSESALGVAQ